MDSSLKGPAKEQYRTLVNEAYRLEDEGKLEAALDRMQEALQVGDHPSVVTTLDEHLRVPHLLQRIGRPVAARGAFTALLDDGYQDQLETPSVQWIERGLIYNAMRRAFSREGLAAEAACYEGLSYLADAYGSYLDSDRKDTEHTAHKLSRTTVEAIAGDMVESIPSGPSAERVTEVLYGAIEQFGAVDVETLFRDVEQTLREILGADC